MATEVTLIIRDPKGRDGATWAAFLEQVAQEHDGEVIEFEEEYV